MTPAALAVDRRFTAFCRMTCVGGSEAGTCPCSHPNDCTLKEDRVAYRSAQLALSRSVSTPVAQPPRWTWGLAALWFVAGALFTNIVVAVTYGVRR